MKNIVQLKEKLFYAMEVKKLYRNHRLSLVSLANEVGCSSYMLSHFLRDYLNTSFYDFINGYRIKEVKEKLQNRDFDKYNIVVLAFESGFNSKATFQRIFKNFTGLTPTEYRLSVIEGKVSASVESFITENV